ncbi:MAG: CDP-alcohol phosphatidyltransferase family protein [Gammaproteobacteria bacterium]|nr:CDP-alcohol phosphatidyltransferase family protein [Gammaproteobacteria bacterium]
MANLITLSRLLLLVVVVVIAYRPPGLLQLINVPLVILIFVTDGIDGYVARKRHETSQFGAMFDIAGDRIVELTLWIVLAHLKLVPVWVPLVFVVRGTIVDAIRASQSSSRRESPFALMETALGKWLVAGRFMRALYAVVKATAFCWLLLLQPLPALAPETWREFGGIGSAIGQGLVLIAVILCLVRGLPVIVEFVYSERRAILGSLAGPGAPGN